MGGVPTTRRIDTTVPLEGGGDLSVDRTLSIDSNVLLDGARADMMNGFYLPLTTTTVSYNNTGPAFTIAPVGATFDYYILNQKYTVGAKTYTFNSGPNPPVTEGWWNFYLDNTGTLNAILINDTELLDDVYKLNAVCGSAYWDSTDGVWMYEGEERHQTSMPAEVHHHLHDVLGAAWIKGLTPTDFTIVGGNPTGDVDGQFSVATGVIHDEDIDFDITGQAFPGSYRVWYRIGANNWKFQAASTLPVLYNGSLLTYNSVGGGVWGQTSVGNGNYVLAHIFATTDPSNPIVVIQGQVAYLGTATLRDGAQN